MSVSCQCRLRLNTTHGLGRRAGQGLHKGPNRKESPGLGGSLHLPRLWVSCVICRAGAWSPRDPTKSQAHQAFPQVESLAAQVFFLDATAGPRLQLLSRLCLPLTGAVCHCSTIRQLRSSGDFVACARPGSPASPLPEPRRISSDLPIGLKSVAFLFSCSVASSYASTKIPLVRPQSALSDNKIEQPGILWPKYNASCGGSSPLGRHELRDTSRPR
jgi:hypothetical protein